MAGTAHDHQLTAGDVIGGRYTVVAPISHGAMGAVYRVHGPDGADVAVKRLLDPRHAARFEIEARLLGRLRHPRVVRVLDHLHDETGKYLVMELVEGSDLARLLDKRGDPGLPVDEVVDYARQACEALQYVHEQNVVHRDVKPANLILGDAGIVLVDFGIAREVEVGDAGTRAIGTPRYMAPEVFVGEAVSPRSDVYSLAATVWALITGRPPEYQDATPLAQAYEGITPQLEATLRRALDLHPERRVASVAALAAALGSPLGVSTGVSLARTIARPSGPRELLEAIVRTAAGVFDAAAASIALVEPATGELVYQAAWGAGADEIVGVRLVPGTGIAGTAVASGDGLAVPDCRADPRFAEQVAAGTGYVPNTMLAVPLTDGGATVGALSVLDRRDGEPYRPADLPRAELFADLAVAALPALQE